jgi:hypothetical protein
MTNVWNLASHLAAAGIGAFLAGVFLWFFPNRKEWIDARRKRREAKIDARVLAAISNYELWNGACPMTGAGVPVVRSAEIAEYLHIDRDVAADSLERLLYWGKVRKESGTLDDPSPTWHHAPR